MGNCCISREGTITATLVYKKSEEDGKVSGRYAGIEDKGDMTDVDDPVELKIKDGRQLTI